MIAVLISCSVFSKEGDEPMRLDIVESTYDVFAIWRLFEFMLGVGTCGVPENVGDIILAFVGTVFCRSVILLKSTTCLFVNVDTDDWRTLILLSSITSAFCKFVILILSAIWLLVTVDKFDCKVEIFCSSCICFVFSVETEVCKFVILLESITCLLVKVPTFVCSVEILFCHLFELFELFLYYY